MSRVRDHWSIGEVLSLLQDEFPEVTISKIRFLESQGLIDPERTRSGYRKFSDTDYDRLYWILEQQRDHYLPLRVIRERLEEGQDISSAPRRSDLRIGDQLPDEAEALSDEEGQDEVGDGGADAPISGQLNSSLDSEVGEDSFSSALAGVTGGVALSDDSDSHPVKDESANALAEAMGADAAGSSDLEASMALAQSREKHALQDSVIDDVLDKDTAVAETLVVEEAVVEEPVVEESAEVANEVEAGTSTPVTSEEADWVEPVSESAPENAPQDEDPDPGDSEDGVVPNQKPAPRLLGTRSERPLPVAKTTAEALAPPPRPTLPGSSVALTREELAEQSGTTPGMIAELEKYGMVVPRQVGGSVLFDSTALTVSRLAVQFGRYGLEPRHLKTFRLGAEREVALLTQSIGPTLKANNPETRRRSYDTLQDLAELSASLRSIIVRDLVADLEPDQ